MIRLMFTMFVTCVLLLFTGVWYARERTPESLASALAPVVERTRELAKAVPKLLLEPEPAPPVERTLQEMTPEEIDERIDEAVEEKIASVREQAFVEAPLEGYASDAGVADASEHVLVQTAVPREHQDHQATYGCGTEPKRDVPGCLRHDAKLPP